MRPNGARWAALAGTLMLMLLSAGPARAAGTKLVRYDGFAVRVPAAWPVFNLASRPETCVRFNRHAVYLGTPRSQERCPAQAVGRTEAILVAPSGRTRAGTEARALAGGNDTTYRAGHVQVSATWGTGRAELSAILGRRLRPAVAARRSATVNRPAGATAPQQARPQEAILSGAQGFDACAAPSTTDMAAWRGTYSGVGVYVGGENRGCAQPNLTAAWVSTEVAAGWHLLPFYVGLQGVGGCSGCTTIDPSQAAAQGTAAADDAVVQAQALGIPVENPIYYDMEAYTKSAANTAAVLAFLQAWSIELHAKGYLSGVYSSASGAIADLASQLTNSAYTQPDEIDIADYNGQSTSTSDPNYISDTAFSLHQRVHQWAGGHNETYGGVTINVDDDFFDAQTADTASNPVQDRFFVDVGGAIYRSAGGAAVHVNSCAALNGCPGALTLPNLNGYAATPAAGTYLYGVPSDTTWEIVGSGQRQQVTTTPTTQAAAITVNDADLAAFPIYSALPAVPSAGTSLPGISGTAAIGQTLTESHATWSGSPTAYTYQWVSCAGGACGVIAGATSATYTVTSADVGHTLRVAEVATNAGGAGAAALSAPTAAVPAPPPARASAQAGRVSGNAVTVPLTCGAGAGTCALKLVLTATEKLRGGKPVSASAAAAGKSRTRARTITLGTKSLVIAPGRSASVKLTLNGPGRALLFRLRRIGATLKVTQGRRVVRSQRLRFVHAKKKRSPTTR